MQQFWDEQLVFDSPESSFVPCFKPPLAKVEPDEISQHFALQSLRSLEAGTKESSINEKKRLAGQRSREKKKNYVKTLEEDVRKLACEIEECDGQISKCKDKLVDAIKSSHSNSNEHSYTFAELERIALSEDPDLDRVNLLIDLIRNRIGACGTERQANLSYNFKQIINAMFPAIYRYLLNTAEYSLDLFAERGEASAGEQAWTAELLAKMNMEEWQLEQFRARRVEFCERRREAVEHTRRLKAAKEKIMRQGELFEHRLGAFRSDLNPIQAALMTLFAERNKLRREFALSGDFESEPCKRIKFE